MLINITKQIKSSNDMKDLLSIKLKDTCQTWKENSKSKKSLLCVVCTILVSHEISYCDDLISDMMDNIRRSNAYGTGSVQ